MVRVTRFHLRIAATLRRWLEGLDRKTWWKIAVAGMKFPRQADFLSHEINAFFQCVLLRAARQHERMVQARDIQIEPTLALN